MEIQIPELSLVLLVGASGAGKSTFAQKHFEKYEVVSSDICRGIVSNTETNQSATKEAFDLLFYIVRQRLKSGLLTVVDATNVQPDARKKLLKIAKEQHVFAVAIVLDMSQNLCEKRNQDREDRNFGTHVIRYQRQNLKRSFRAMRKEGFKDIFTLKSMEEVESVTAISRKKLYSNKKDIKGSFDIIGDIHGCYLETVELLQKLGYTIQKVEDNGKNYGLEVTHPEGRKVIFLGDLVDRGPDSPSVLRLVMSMVNQESAFCVVGNHDIKLQRKLKGKNVNLNHGLEETMQQLEKETPAFLYEVKEFLYTLTSHYVFDEGKLVVAHAGLREEMHGRTSGAVRSFCMYGETTGETDEFGLPVRHDWASEYRGKAKVVYGHTPVLEAEWLNRTIDIDTGCVFGGKLTALRYPEEELVAVSAHKEYCQPAKPMDYDAKKALSQQQENDDILHIEDVTGKRIIQTRLRNNLTIKEENAIPALEVMSRFTVNPKWLIYLPPTMSPCETSTLPEYLEYPEQAINYYQQKGIEKVVLEEKHMGSRAVLIICKNKETVQKRFGILEDEIGICYTRTGRNFFTDTSLEKQFLESVQKALTESGFWEKHQTDWVCLDAELMPWSAKAQALLKDQYASAGASAKNALTATEAILQQAKQRGVEGVTEVLEKVSYKKTAVSKYVDAYRNYCWEVKSVEDYKLAPFHILATEGAVHTDKNHEWHLQNIEEIYQADPQLFQKTVYKVIDTTNPESIQKATDWWLSLTEKGGEGMVVKPYDFIVQQKGYLVQPAIKCRGKEYLRIIYGPEYDMPSHLKRLKVRKLNKKQSLASREFALGVESLERFVRKEPLRRVHESVFGVMALESEEVDPRL